MKSIRLVLAALFAAALSFAVPVQAASLVYDSYLNDVWQGNVTTGATYKCALVTSTYTPNRATHTKFSDVTNEVTGTGYTAGGNTVVPTFTLDTTNHKMVVVFPQTSWSTATITARGAVCYRSTGTASTSQLVLYNDFGADVTSTAGTFTLNASTLNFNAP